MSNEWIEWNGGECPVAKGTLVDVKYRDAQYSLAQPAGIKGGPLSGGAFAWSHIGVDGDIIAYRLHEPEQEVPLIQQLAEAVKKRDHISGVVERYKNGLDATKKEVSRIAGELEREIEEATGLSCNIGYKWDAAGDSKARHGSVIPDGVDVDDPKTWEEGDIIECIFAHRGSPCFTKGKEYIFSGKLEDKKFVVVVEDDQGDEFASWKAKFRFIRRPS